MDQRQEALGADGRDGSDATYSFYDEESRQHLTERGLHGYIAAKVAGLREIYPHATNFRAMAMQDPEMGCEHCPDGHWLYSIGADIPPEDQGDEDADDDRGDRARMLLHDSGPDGFTWMPYYRSAPEPPLPDWAQRELRAQREDDQRERLQRAARLGPRHAEQVARLNEIERASWDAP